MAKKKTKEEILKTHYRSQDGLRKRKDNWKELKKISQLFGWSSDEVSNLILKEANRDKRKISELPYYLQKQFYDLYTKYDNPGEAFKKMKGFFKKPGVNIKCNSVQRLKNLWSELNRSIGVQRKGNYRKPHNTY
jgi:hypothetical protein